jgi:murein DD-endopeptidase MepM/ murein hydrolase activator NlpD
VAQDLSVSLSKITGQLKEVDKLSKSIAKAWSDTEKTAGKITGAMGSGGGNFMASSLGKISSMAIGFGASAMGAAVGAAPQLGQVVERATGFYNAGVMQGGLSQGRIYNRLRGNLGEFGVQTPMAVAQLAQFYGTSGIRMGTSYEGGLTRAVGNAASYLNMDSNRAAEALAGLNSGRGSGSLLRQFGIFTADPRTGKMYNQTQIFSQLSGRLTAGRGKASVEDVQNSMFRGNLGATLRDSGLSEDQQQLFYQYELAKAAGINMDLSDNKSMSAAKAELEKRGLINPQNSLNKIASSEESVLQSYTQPYLDGLKAAVPLIEGMNEALKSVPDAVKALLGGAQAIGSTNAGQGAMGLLGDVGGALLGGAASYLGGKAGGGGKGAKGAGSMLKSIGKGGVIGTVAALAGTAVGNAVSGGAAAGTGQAKFGNAVSYAAQFGGIGAMIGSIFPGAGTAIGAGLGALAGGLYGYATGGGYEGFGGKGAAGTTASAKKDRPNFVKPASGNITSGYGPRKAPIAGASTFHRGVDIANALGTAIVAAGDGTVIFTGPSGSYGNHIKIEHGNGYVTTYSHLSRIAAKRGQTVTAGQRIGNMGTTGVSTGSHLHFEVLRNGANVDPATVVPGLILGSSVTATITGGAGGKGKKTEAQAKAATTAERIAEMTSKRSGGLLGVSNGILNGVSQGLDNALLGVDQNESILGGAVVSGVSTASKSPGAKYTGTGGGSSSGSMSMPEASGSTASSSRGGVVINLTIAKASDSEARRFAKMVKSILDDEASIAKIGKM